MTTTVRTDTEPTRQRARRALRVLVADDERDIVLTLTELPREEGHEAHGLYDGTDVMPAVRDFDPDVVLLDIAMPGMTGWEVARQIRQVCGHERPLLIAPPDPRQTGRVQLLPREALRPERAPHLASRRAVRPVRVPSRLAGQSEFPTGC